MKKKIFATCIGFACLSGIFAQNKDEIKDIEKEYAMFTNHDKFFKNKEWAMCKFSVVYKLTTAMVSKSMVKNDEIKVKSSSGAYAILNGVSEEDLQKITNRVAENFMKRMKDEAGVNIATWSSFKDSKNTEDLKKEQEDKEIYSKSQGLAYAMTYDSTPHYNRIIVFIPGGKSLSKELKKNVMEMCLYIDFADVVATATAKITESPSYYYWSKGNDQKMYAGVRLVPNLGSEAVVGEMGKNLSGTTIKGHDQYGYMMSMGLQKEIISPIEYAEKIEPTEGKIPAILSNRRNNKLDGTTTFNVYTNPSKFSDAVMDVTNQYFDNFIKVYKFRAAE